MKENLLVEDDVEEGTVHCQAVVVVNKPRFRNLFMKKLPRDRNRMRSGIQWPPARGFW